MVMTTPVTTGVMTRLIRVIKKLKIISTKAATPHTPKMVANTLFSSITYQECRNEQESNVRFFNINNGAQRETLLNLVNQPILTDPNTGETHSSTLKPIGGDITTKNLNTSKRVIDSVTVEAANEDEIANTVKVMGGEDWEMWIDALKEADVLADGFKTTAYTYIGKKLTWPIYGHATIGKAKEDLDRAVLAIRELTSDLKGEAYVSSLNAVVTQASSAIPIMPLYISALFKVMKEDGTYEGVIQQIAALFKENLFGETPRFDDGGHLFQNYKELEDAVQERVQKVWDTVDTDTIDEMTDYKGYHQEFLHLFGFDYDNVDYDADVNPEVEINGMI